MSKSAAHTYIYKWCVICNCVTEHERTGLFDIGNSLVCLEDHSNLPREESTIDVDERED